MENTLRELTNEPPETNNVSDVPIARERTKEFVQDHLMFIEMLRNAAKLQRKYASN
jgi:hypothetical protein